MMNMTIQNNTIDTFEAKLKGDIEQLREQLIFARRTPEKMSAFYGFSFIETNRIDSQAVDIIFNYGGGVLLHVLLHNKEVSFHKYGLDNYTLGFEETMQLFESIQPELQALAFYL